MSFIEQKEKWLRENPDATLEQAYSAGYWQECDNWCDKTR